VTNAILLALDDSEFSRAATGELIAHVRPDSTTVHVLHVLELDHMLTPAFDFARGSSYGADVAAHLQASRGHAERLVAEAAAQLLSARFRAITVVREGEPRHLILDYAAEISCDCIVMGSHGRKGFDRFFMGSVSENVMRHAHCSVHIVRRPTRPRTSIDSR
jgi:nucleotide-binding universal stress UspA family protein